MKNIVLLFVLLTAFKMHSQEIKKDSVIKLNEVIIDHKKHKTKITKIKTKGDELASHPFEYNSVEVSLIKDIPVGTLQSVTFHFNVGLVNMAKKALEIVYKDTPLALVIYEVNPDGTPGKAISDKQIQFTVKANFKGSMELDLASLHIPTQPHLFIGLVAMSEQKGHTVVVKIYDNPNAVTYFKKYNSDAWEEDKGFPHQIRMTVKVAGE